MQDMKERIFSDEIKKLMPVLGRDTAERLAKAYLLGDEKTKERIVVMIDAVKAAVFSDSELRNSVLMEPPSQSDMVGDISLGKVLYGKKKLYPFKMESSEILTHIGVFGSSGYGKTNISYGMIEQLVEAGVPVLIFDFSKRNYRDLLSTKLKDKIDVYTVGRNVAPLKFNPFNPPKDVSQMQWLKEFAAIFDHAYWLLGGGTHIILKALAGVNDSYNMPKISDMKRWIEEYSQTSLTSREKNWLSTATRPLESLCMGEIGEMFDCDIGVSPSSFFEKQIGTNGALSSRVTVLELDAMSTSDKTFFIEIIMQWLRDWLLVGKDREKLKGVIILEEAHHVLNREKAKKLGSETVVDLLFREIRELGIGIMYIDQHPSLVSYPALGNTSTHIYMNLGLDTKQSSDILDASNMLGLNYQEEGYYLRQLPVGHGFVLMRHSNHPRPFLVEFPQVNIEKGSITDDDVREQMKGKIIIEARDNPITIGRTDAYASLHQELDDNAWKVLKSIGRGDGVFTSQIYRAIKMSGTTFAENVRKLAEAGYVNFKEVKNNKNTSNYYFLTDLGKAMFEKRFEGTNTNGEVKIDKQPILEIFRLNGWTITQENGIVKLSNASSKPITLHFVTTYDRNTISQMLNDHDYYLCANEPLSNIFIQEAVKHVSENRRPLTVFVATYSDFEKGGAFERVFF